MKKKWEIRYWFGDDVVASCEVPGPVEKAVKRLRAEAKNLGIRNDLGDEPVAVDYVELVYIELDDMEYEEPGILWYNNYGDSGSDYCGDDRKILDAISEA